MDYQVSLQKCQQLTNILKKIKQKSQQPPDADFLKLLRQALTAAQALQEENIAVQLSAVMEALERQLTELTEHRREALWVAAREAAWPCKRFDRFDRLLPLEVEYQPTKVRLKVGSETYQEVQELDGARLFHRVKEAAEKLAQAPFQREEFFRLLHAAYAFVRQTSSRSDDWLHIRQLYPTMVLLQQTMNQEFMKQPEGRQFRSYPSAQFVYDLSRFGQEGWSCRGYKLETRTPSMRETAQAMILPNLASVEQPGPQIAHLHIVKQEVT
ncbi:MAG: hypothetical protein FJ135_14855 [Deltaproteobacteria bacterium]|nr:hypothetical protein [Deltaproteobacteria bacterium]